MPRTSKYTPSLLHGLNKSNFSFPAERHSRKPQLSVLLSLSADSMSLKKCLLPPALSGALALMRSVSYSNPP